MTDSLIELGKSPEAQQEVFTKGLQGLVSRVRETPVAFMDRVYYLPKSKGGAKWTTRPDQIGVALMMAHPDIRDWGMIKCTQDGITEIGTGITCLKILEGHSSGYFMPKDGMARSHSQGRFNHWIESTPELMEALLADAVDQKVPGNSLQERSFINSTLYVRGAASPKNLSEIPIVWAIVDEPNRTDTDVGSQKVKHGDKVVSRGEGGALGIIGGRFGAQGFGWLRTYGSPTHLGGRIESFIEQCRHVMALYIPCPSCNKYQTLDWGSATAKHGFKWDIVLDEKGETHIENTAATAHYVCKHCQGRFTQSDYQDIKNRCEWFSSSGLWFDCKEGSGEFKKDRSGKFDLDEGIVDGDWHVVPAPAKVGIRKSKDGSGLYGATLWTEACRRFLEAVHAVHTTGDTTELLQPFMNTYRAIPFSIHRKKQVDGKALMEKRVTYTERGGKIPKHVDRITMQGDFQKRFCKYQLIGHSEQGLYPFECKRIEGRTMDPDARMWTELDDLLTALYEREDGVKLPVELALFDARHGGDNVIKLCSGNPQQRIGVYGMGAESTPYFEIDQNKHWRTADIGGVEYGAYSVPINAPEASKRMYHRLDIKPGRAGAIYFPIDDDFNEDYFDELTADQLRPTQTPSGEVVDRYRKEGSEANEAHDLMKYGVICDYALPKYVGQAVDHSQPQPQTTNDTPNASDLVF